MNDTDLMIIESLLQDEQLIKSADTGGLVAAFSDKIKELVEAHYDPNDKTGSLINILGPGVIFASLNALGFKKIGLLVGLLMNVFHINLNSIVRSIWSQLSPAISSGSKLSSSQVDDFVHSAVSTAIPNLGSEASLVDVRMLKLALEEYKSAAPSRSFFDDLASRRGRAGSILIRILSWVFKIALASAGLLIAGDVINKFIGRPNAFDKTLNKGQEQPVAQGPVSTFTAKQTKFPLKSGYVPERHDSDTPWIENVPNNESSIEQMLVDFAKDVYSGLDGKESLIQNSPAFSIIKDRILWYNHTSPDAPIVYLPGYFTSKKQIVDYFIDDVAEKSQ